jgi:WbqC-like protein
VKVGVIQSNYIPWRGYFDFIRSVDLFIFYDDVQFSKNHWRNRNKIKTDQGLRWVSVPVYVRSLPQLICETRIDYTKKWHKSHRGMLLQWYNHTPFFRNYFNDFCDIAFRRYENLSELNIALIRWVMGALQITTPTRLSQEFRLSGSRNERLLDLLKQVGATSYLSGPSAQAYLDESLFRQEGIQVEYKTYDYPPYPQSYGAFEDRVTVLDLLFHCGTGSPKYLVSK